jgi:hypothetical protein
VCAPTTLGTAPPGAGIFAIALLPDGVVWAAGADPGNGGPNHAVYMCPKTGCAGAPSLTAPNEAAGGVATNGIDRSYVSFVYNGINGVFELLPGGQFARVGGVHVVVHGLHADGDALHFLALYEPGGADRTLRRFDRADGGDSAVCVVAQAAAGNVESAAYGGGYAYLTAHDVGHITACALATGAITDYTTATEPVVSTTTTADRLFWTGASGALRSCTLGATCASIRDELAGIAVADVIASGTDLVFATTTGDLERCTAESCALDHAVLAHARRLGSSDPIYGHAVAADDASYFYGVIDEPLTDGGPPPTWKLMRLAK